MISQKRLLILLSVLLLVLFGGLAHAQLKVAVTPTSTGCVPQEYPLTYGAGQGAGSGTVAGKVIVWNDQDTLYVKYQIDTGKFPGLTLTETHVAICDTAFDTRPEPGLSPYKRDHGAGTTSTTYEIPLTGMLLHPDCPSCTSGAAGFTALKGRPQPCSFDAQCQDTLYLATHAALSNGETAYGGTCEKPSGGAWFCQIAYTICCGAAPPPPGGCQETAWGFRSGGECFINITELKANNWGWTNQIPATYPQTYTLTLYAGAAQCNTAKGKVVGTVTVVYDGSKATVTYAANQGYSFAETHVWVGSTKLPLKNPSKPALGFTNAPGRFPYKDGDSVTIAAPFWVAAHAKVNVPCGD